MSPFAVASPGIVLRDMGRLGPRELAAIVTILTAFTVGSADALCRFQLSHRRRGFEESPEPRGCPELRNRIEFFECRGERVRQAPHGSGLELLVLRIEIEFVHPPCQVSRNLQISFDECPVDRQLCRLC